MTLLIVDDEQRIRELIRKYAVFEGYEVDEAADGMQAVEKCRAHRYDLVIMDVMMPELDGFSACREIRKTSQVPMLMLSARGEEYDRIHGFELGVDDYVVKPFSPKELMMRVGAILKRSAAAPAASAANCRPVFSTKRNRSPLKAASSSLCPLSGRTSSAPST